MSRKKHSVKRSTPKPPTPPAASAPLSRWRKYAQEKRAWASLVRSLRAISANAKHGVKSVARKARKVTRKAVRRRRRR